MNNKLLTIAECAKQAGIPESTARFYRDKFESYIPFVGQGRQRRYKPETVEVLRLIAEGFNRNLTATEIEYGLSRVFAASVDTVEETAITTAATQQQSNYDQNISLAMTLVSEQIKKSMEQMSHMIESTVKVQQEMMNEQQREIAELRKVVLDLHNAESERLRFAADKDKEIGERIAKLEQKKSVWQRLFGK
jgi:DNA-binding transcriptional MerR regulator